MVAQQDNSVGPPIGRSEDQRLLTGCGRFVADLDLPNQLFACVLRSSHAHARIVDIDAAAASEAPGVRGVYTAAELAAAGLSDMPRTKMWMPAGPALPSRPLLARETVRFVGEGVALVVADTLSAALDAAELIEVEYDVLPPLIDMRAASEFCS